MTTRFPTLGSLRALAASRRRGHLAGGSWSTIHDRDLDRVALDLLVISQTDARRPAVDTERREPRMTRPVDLHDRRLRGRGQGGPGAPAPHARAS